MIRKFKTPFVIIAILIAQSVYGQNESIRFFYLGHSSFLIFFDNETSVLTDYGKPNAFFEYGWNSPIYDIGNFQPTIVTYSHSDADHYDSTRTPNQVKFILKKPDVLKVNNVSIYSILTSEDDISIKNNCSYLFVYKGVKILHLGDCQSNIIKIDSSINRDYITKSLIMNCDVVLMPIEGKTKFISQTEKFINIIHPKVVIPMHYWSEAYKQAFFNKISEKVKVDKMKYKIVQVKNSSYNYFFNSLSNDSITIVNIYPSKYDGKELNK